MRDNELQNKRLIAAAIDIGIGVALAIVLGIGVFILQRVIGWVSNGSMLGLWFGRIGNFVSALVSLAYILGRDVLAGGTSIGKRTQEIRVVTKSGAPIAAIDSAKRNAIFALGSLLAALVATLQLVPCLGDAVACLLLPLLFLGGLVSLAAGVVEIVKITQDPNGVRFGDEWAGTRVVR